MSKVLILQSLYDLSDEQLEFMIKDRLSFMRFLGLKMEDAIPDGKSVWHYRGMFTNTNTMDRLFRKFNRMLGQRGFRAKKGTLTDVDARWGSKHGTPTFGYKAHAAVDNKNKMTRDIETTPANVHDSKAYGSLLKRDGNSSKDVWAEWLRGQRRSVTGRLS